MDGIQYEPPGLAWDTGGGKEIHFRQLLPFPMEIMEYEYRPPEAELLRWCQGR